MQISLSWLNELLDLRGYHINFLIERLTVNGFEIEECKSIISGKKISVSIVMSTTANRGDVLSIRGIAKEVKIIIQRIKKFKVWPHVRNVREVNRFCHQIRWLRYWPSYDFGGDKYRRFKRIGYNIIKINRILLRHKLTKKVTLNEFKWRIENTIYRSPKWKRNRLYFKQPIFNTNDPKIYSKFICWTIENLIDLSSPKLSNCPL